MVRHTQHPKGYWHRQVDKLRDRIKLLMHERRQKPKREKAQPRTYSLRQVDRLLGRAIRRAFYKGLTGGIAWGLFFGLAGGCILTLMVSGR